MAQTVVAAPLTPMTPDAVISAFNYLRAVQACDAETAAGFAAAEPRIPALLLDVADRIVLPITTLPGAQNSVPCNDSFALEALGKVFLGTLRSWEQAGTDAAAGIARAVIRFTAEILTEDHEDIANVLHQLHAVALRQALEAHPAPGAPHRRVAHRPVRTGRCGARIQCASRPTARTAMHTMPCILGRTKSRIVTVHRIACPDPGAHRTITHRGRIPGQNDALAGDVKEEHTHSGTWSRGTAPRGQGVGQGVGHSPANPHHLTLRARHRASTDGAAHPMRCRMRRTRCAPGRPRMRCIAGAHRSAPDAVHRPHHARTGHRHAPEVPQPGAHRGDIGSPGTGPAGAARDEDGLPAKDLRDQYERAEVKATGEDRHHDLGARVGAIVSREGNMTLTSDQQTSAVEPLAEQTVVAACALADAAGPESWSASAVEDTAAALEVLAGALAQLDPECAEILSVVPVAAAAVLERVERARTGDGPQDDGRGAAGTSTALRQALTAHGITRHRVHQLGAALITVTLDAADAQALAALLAQRGEIPDQVRHDDQGWGEGPAETAAAALAETLAVHGPSAYARVLASGQVSAGLTPGAARRVVATLGSRPSTGSRTGRRRGLGPGYKGLPTS
ncbi:hypothetical protein [Streptomyces klenkii]|uniref:hypothetical protein n=1 Tax=Streptomyces klenkii TaxID=1420899 RepID=UPI0034265B53